MSTPYTQWLASRDVGDIVCYRIGSTATKLTIGRITPTQIVCTNNQRFSRERGTRVGRREYQTIVPWTEEHDRESHHQTLIRWLVHGLQRDLPSYEQLIAMKAAYEAAIPAPAQQEVAA